MKTPEREPLPANTAPPFPNSVLCNRDLGFVPAAGRPLSMAKPPLPRTHSQEDTPQLGWTSVLSSPLCLEQLCNQSTIVWRTLFIGLLRDIVLCAIGLGAITTINYNSHGGPVLKDRGPLWILIFLNVENIRRSTQTVKILAATMPCPNKRKAE